MLHILSSVLLGECSCAFLSPQLSSIRLFVPCYTYTQTAILCLGVFSDLSQRLCVWQPQVSLNPQAKLSNKKFKQNTLSSATSPSSFNDFTLYQLPSLEIPIMEEEKCKIWLFLCMKYHSIPRLWILKLITEWQALESS